MHSLREQSLPDYLTQMVQHLKPMSSAQCEEELREVHAHLESAVEAMRENGLSETEAVKAALAQFGQARAVAHGLVVAWKIGETKKKEIVVKKRIVFGASMVMVTLATLWLVFAASMIGRMLFPEGQFLIHASEGASLQVHQGVVQVLAAGNNGTGVERVNGAVLVPAIAVPFVLLVSFAVVGCCSLLRSHRPAR